MPMKLLTKTILGRLPPLGSTDGQRYEAIVRCKFFTPDSDLTFYITEYDPAERVFFGLTFNSLKTDQSPRGEFAYLSEDELRTGHGPLGLAIERDLHFKERTLAEALRTEHGIEPLPTKAPSHTPCP